jgi:dimethylargininase
MQDESSEETISLIKARQQHEQYIRILKQHIPSVICLPAVEDHPDCVFVEDTVVAVGTTACVTRQGAPSRQGEERDVKQALRSAGIGNIHDMDEIDSLATCDGGDVLYTGRHLFVGLSTRTNPAGAKVLSDVFEGLNVPVITVPLIYLPISHQTLHLKSVITHLDESTILAPANALGDQILNAMQATERGYHAVRLPSTLACNVVVANGHVLAQDTDCMVSKERIQEAVNTLDMGLTFIDTSELAKKDGALTCCSVLLSV